MDRVKTESVAGGSPCHIGSSWGDTRWRQWERVSLFPLDGTSTVVGDRPGGNKVTTALGFGSTSTHTAKNGKKKKCVHLVYLPSLSVLTFDEMGSNRQPLSVLTWSLPLSKSKLVADGAKEEHSNSLSGETSLQPTSWPTSPPAPVRVFPVNVKELSSSPRGRTIRTSTPAPIVEPSIEYDASCLLAAGGKVHHTNRSVLDYRPWRVKFSIPIFQPPAHFPVSS